MGEFSQKSYTDEQIAEWLRLTPQERMFEAEKLWEEFLLKYPKPWKPFWKSFDSFEEYEEWKMQQEDPRLW